MFKKRYTQNRGLLLIDLLLSFAILSILSVITVIVFSNQVEKAQDMSIKNDLNVLRLALFEYYDDYKCFPKLLPDCGESFTFASKTYLKKIPCQDNNIEYGYEVENSDCSSWFKILANLKNTSDPSIDIVGCRKGCGPNCVYNYGITSTNVLINANCPVVLESPTPQLSPTLTSSPVIYYACAPPAGHCIQYIDPFESQCPVVYMNDDTCKNSCYIKENQCKNEKGKKN